MEEMPIKYVKDKDGKFLPITSPNAVINEDGKNINELYVSYESGVEVEPQINELLEKIYPIGSIYMSVNNVSPQEFLGGTWERIQDRFLLGAGSTYSAGSTGGEATHTLTINEMPSHKHSIYIVGSQSGEWIGFGGGAGTQYAQWNSQYIKETGGSQPHNNMPPYLAVYMWQRIG
jgi:hypothetical protein